MIRIFKNRGVLVLGLGALGIGTIGAIIEFRDFMRLLQIGEMEKFAMVTLVNYALVGAGFLLLLLWFFLKGDMRDVERPKYDMLEQEEELKRQGQ